MQPQSTKKSHYTVTLYYKSDAFGVSSQLVRDFQREHMQPYDILTTLLLIDLLVWQFSQHGTLGARTIR